MNENISLYKGDCLEVMDSLIKQEIKVDAIITDLPYGTIACKWDSVIPFTWHIKEDKNVLYLHDALIKEYSLKYFKENKISGMWERLNKLIKPNGAIVLFGSEPFSSALRMSNIKNYKYDWVWEKNTGTNFLHAKRQPIRYTENIHVFINGTSWYNAQKTTGCVPTNSGKGRNTGNVYSGKSKVDYKGGDTTRFPKNIIKFNTENNYNRVHPTQKPIKLMVYFIRTYTNEGETVLDFTMGSGSTGVACVNTKRKFIGIDNGFCEKENSQFYNKPWVDVAEYRMKEANLKNITK